MIFSSKALLLGVTFAAHALAQTRIAFTSVPALVVAGESYNITWGGGDGSPVTVTLRQDPSALKTIATLADGVEENFLLWNVSKSLETASDYTLQITQGQDSINYSGLFSIAGGAGTSVISYSGMTSTTTATNGTASMTLTGTASSGTESVIPRNMTTFTAPTVTASSSISLTPAVTEHMSSSTASSEAGATVGPSAAATTTAAPGGGAVQLGYSSVALVMGVFAAVMFLT